MISIKKNKSVILMLKMMAISYSFLLLSTNSYGQNKLNYGLLKQQDTATLPKSRVPVIRPLRKLKVVPQTKLIAGADSEFEIVGGWELSAGSKIKQGGALLSKAGVNTSSWYNATVPGTVLTTLVKQGVYPDPYFGLNNMAIPDSLCRQDWWYRTTFAIPLAKQGQKCRLVFNGINYRAEIWLNGKKAGEIKGAFKKGMFNITGDLRAGKNVLAVHILPPDNPGIPHEESPSAGIGPNGGKLTLDGPTFIASEGWDWVPGIRDRNIGIWQNVKLKFTGDVMIGNSQVVTDLPLPDTTSAKLSIRTSVINLSGTSKQIRLNGEIAHIKFTKTLSLTPGETKFVSITPDEFPQLNIKSPRLWWPNGYGNAALYQLNLSVDNSDQQTVRFGVRELSYELSADLPSGNEKRVEYNPVTALKNGKAIFDNVNRRKLPNGNFVPTLKKDADPDLLTPLADKDMSSYLVIKVNGQRIYCRGGNWGMDDAMKQVSRAHLEPYFKLHKQAHFNMIRNWTGESTEEDFYDLCDEYGLLVWNDFWLSTEGYNLNVTDNQLFLANAEDVVKRFVNHPSIAVWCPRNEGFAPVGLEDELASIIAKYDGTRLYQSNSRVMNLRTSGPWNFLKDPTKYYSSLASGFSTELGTPSVPTAASIRKMMAGPDTWPIGDVWYYHDLHNGQKDYINEINTVYGQSVGLDDFCKKAQMVNYDSHRTMFEAWNSKLWNNTSGLLLWMTHPAWPSTVWQVYSWDYETFGSYYGSQKACEPIHIQMNLDDNKIVVLNTTLKPLRNAKVSLDVYDLSGKKLYSKTSVINAEPNRLTVAFNGDIPDKKNGVCLVRLLLTDSRDQVISQNDYWQSSAIDKNMTALNGLPEVKLKCKLMPASGNGKMLFSISNNSETPAIAVKLNLKDKLTHDIILPAYFSDGYFNLLPGESKQIIVEYPVRKNGIEVVAEGYNINSARLL